jgi:hypothetical protein
VASNAVVVMRINEITQQVFYHGTARRNMDFRSGRVAYFAYTFNEAREHALMDSEVDGDPGFVIEANLDMKNPIVLPTFEMQDLHIMVGRVRELLQQGHDCALGDHPDSREICVLDPRFIHVRRIIPVQSRV